jgi:LAO/AO transport system kinase
MKEEIREDNGFKSALRVQEGVDQPEQVNEQVVRQLRQGGKQLLSADEYTAGIISSNRTILSRAITLVESALPQHQELAQEVIRLCLPHTGRSLRIGITGVPGVGKSTFIEAFGTYLTAKGNKVAVLAIDPSSQRSGGSILGDKTRMEHLSNDPNAFIRPSPSAGSLGGVARKTQETLLLCEAAGFNILIIETVGVGQSETAVHGMVDFFLLLMLAGAGDELQGIKRGIMEMADAIVINKADGDNIQKAKLARAEYANALHLFSPPESGWIPTVDTISSRTGEGIERVWENIQEYRVKTTASGHFDSRRLGQARSTMLSVVEAGLKQQFFQNPTIRRMMKSLESELIGQKISPYVAAQMLLESWLCEKTHEDTENTEQI